MTTKILTVSVAVFALGVAFSSIPVFAQQNAPGYSPQGGVIGVPVPAPGAPTQHPTTAAPGGPAPGYSGQGTVTGVAVPPPGTPAHPTPTTGPGGVPISPGGAGTVPDSPGGPAGVPVGK